MLSRTNHKNSSPTVSVVIPVYNAAKYIGVTLAAVAAQEFDDFDVHIIDDCSTDESASIIMNFCAVDDRFHYHSVAENFGGPAGPRNIGIAAATGDFIAFCDADDVWVPYKLAVQLAIAQRSNADAVCAVTRDFTDENSLPAFPRPTGEIPIRRISHRRLLVKNWIALSSVVVRRSVLNSVGPFNEAKTHIAVEDFDMWLRITQRGARVFRVNAPLVHYRKLPTSISASKSMMIRKALNIIGEDYERRGLSWLFRIIRPLHWLAYVGSSAWMRSVLREL